MKRFKIANIHGQNFQVEANDLKEVYGESLPTEWGKPAWVETKITPAVLDDEGNIITPAKTEEINHPAEYSIEVVDITAEIEAKEKSKKDKEALALEVEALKNKSGAWTTAELTKAMKLLLAK